MKVIVREVCTDDWKAIYLNDNLAVEGHSIYIEDICWQLQNLITHNGDVYKQPDYITSITYERYWLKEEYVAFLPKFSDYNEYVFE